MRREFVLLDLLRFFAALCVLAFHFEIFALKGATGPARLFGGFDAAVDFFFVLSGFVIAYSAADRMSSVRDYGAFIWRRVARLYPLHILTLLIAVALAAAAAIAGVKLESGQRYALEYLPANLILTQAWGFHDRLTFNVVSWSISAEWFLYLTFPLSLWLARRLDTRVSLILLVLFYAGLRWLEHRYQLVPWNDRTYQGAMIRALPAFFLGVLLWRIWRETMTQIRLSPMVPLGLTVVAGVMMWLRAPSEALVALFGVIVLTGAVAERGAADGAGHSTGHGNEVARLLGNASYGLYMWHHLIGTVIFGVLKPQGLAMMTLTVIVAAAISIIAAIASYRVFERPVQLALLRKAPRTA